MSLNPTLPDQRIDSWRRNEIAGKQVFFYAACGQGFASLQSKLNEQKELDDPPEPPDQPFAIGMQPPFPFSGVLIQGQHRGNETVQHVLDMNRTQELPG